MADADIVIVMLDVSDAVTEEDRDIIGAVREVEHIIAFNKIDKVPSELTEKVISEISDLRSRVLPLSAKTGEGLDKLKKAIVGPFSQQDVSVSGFLVTDARHYDLLCRAQAEIEQSLDQINQKMSEEIVLIGLHNSLRYLGEITGETTTEDMLTRIFSTFCIGK